MHRYRLIAVLFLGVLGVVILFRCSSPRSSPSSSTTANQPAGIAPKTTEHLVCRWQWPPGDDVFVWFIVDRSSSMFRSSVKGVYRNQLYSLPGLFIHTGMVLNQIFDRPRYRFSLHLSGPHHMVFPLEDPSALTKPWDIVEGKTPSNEYGVALDVVYGEMKAALAGYNKQERSPRLVVLFLTDGTYSVNSISEAKKERQEVTEALGKIKSLENAESYVVLLPSNEDTLPWDDFLKEKLVTGVYRFPEELVDLGKEIFPSIDGPAKTGWFSNTTEVVRIPDFFLKANFSLITLGGGQLKIESPSNLPASPIHVSGKEVQGRYFQGSHLWYYQQSVHLFNPPFTMTLSPDDQNFPLLGFYTISGEPSDFKITIESEVSVNGGSARLIVTVPSLLSGFSTVEIESKEVQFTAGTQDLVKGVASFEWKPLANDEPGDKRANVVIRGAGNEILNCGPVILSVRFWPIPLSAPEITCLEKPPLPPLCVSQFGFRYHPPGQTPWIYLCSSDSPPLLIVETPSCNTPFPEGALECPTPVAGTPIPECQYRVSAEWAEGDPSYDQPIVVRGSGNPEGYVYTYTVTMPQCYLYHCGYERIVFQWMDSSTSVAREVGWALDKDKHRWRLLNGTR